MPDLVPPLVDFIPTLAWFKLVEGSASVLKQIITISAPGPTTLPAAIGTFTDVYVNAAGAVNITMPASGILVQGQEWLFKDTSGKADVNPITITAGLVDGDSYFQINIPWGSVRFAWNGFTWSIIQ